MKDKDFVLLNDLWLLHTTDKAYLIRNIDNEEVWIPKSQVEYIEFGRDKVDGKGKPVKEIYALSISRWIAAEKGML